MITLVAVLAGLLLVSRAYALVFITVYIIHFTWCQLVSKLNAELAMCSVRLLVVVVGGLNRWVTLR